MKLQHAYLIYYLTKCVEVLFWNKAVFVPIEEMWEEMAEFLFL